MLVRNVRRCSQRQASLCCFTFTASHRRVLDCHRHRRLLRRPICHVPPSVSPIITAPPEPGSPFPEATAGIAWVGPAGQANLRSYYRRADLELVGLQSLGDRLCCVRHGEQLLRLQVRPSVSVSPPYWLIRLRRDADPQCPRDLFLIWFLAVLGVVLIFLRAQTFVVA